MYDDFLPVTIYGKLSTKFLLGTSVVIEKVGLLSYFLFVARTTIRIRLNVLIHLTFLQDFFQGRGQNLLLRKFLIFLLFSGAKVSEGKTALGGAHPLPPVKKARHM